MVPKTSIQNPPIGATLNSSLSGTVKTALAPSPRVLYIPVGVIPYKTPDPAKIRFFFREILLYTLFDISDLCVFMRKVKIGNFFERESQ